MLIIKFEKTNPKILDCEDDPIQTARLLGVFPVDYSQLDWWMKEYDGERKRGTKEYDMLIFQKPEDNLWDTVNTFVTFRKHNPIYNRNVGKVFMVKVGS